MIGFSLLCQTLFIDMKLSTFVCYIMLYVCQMTRVEPLDVLYTMSRLDCALSRDTQLPLLYSDGLI